MILFNAHFTNSYTTDVVTIFTQQRAIFKIISFILDKYMHGMVPSKAYYYQVTTTEYQ